MRNIYFSAGARSEQNLYEDLVIESLKIYGQDVYYLPRDIVNEDRILGDDVPSKFNSSHKIEMYIENIEGYDGEGDLFSRFGVEIRDEATFVVARKRWKQTVARYDNEITGERPREGDLIYIPLSSTLFQITHVEHEQPFYQLSNLPVYKLRCTLFEYNDEDLDTGIASIDNIETKYAYTYVLELNRDGVIEIGSDVTQIIDSANGISMKGEVSHWSDSDHLLHVIHAGANDGKFHSFVPGRTITVDGNGYTLVSVSEENKISNNEQNTDFSSFSDAFIDFTEDNPFGTLENN